MDNSCRLKLEWIPAAYREADKGTNDTLVGKLKQAQPLNEIYQSGNSFAKHKVYKRKP
ncbi:MAG: hypothetical protein JWQ57_3860 [Mucilaginibacter sp.]|nr:hypothetical protein [Mucilaginibacter sp.]